MNRLIVKSVDATGGKLTIDFDCIGQIKKFLRGNRFFAEYSTSIEDTPESILVIPFLSTVCPIAWANPAEVYVETVDETFLQSLENVRLALQRFYPRINFSSKIYVNRIVTSHVNVRTKSMMLFSGGVDSLATYIRHQTENPVLVAVHGSDVHVNDYEHWRVVAKNFKEFSKANGATLRTVRSNFCDLVDDLMLKIYYEALHGDWWSRVMHGLAFLGLCAPLTYVDEIGKLYIASSYTADFHKPWGSAPEIDNNVMWTGTRCVHDGFELSRQEKMQMIAEYIKRKRCRLNIRSCNTRGEGLKRSEVGNCCSSKCEKCSRTIVGLELAGLNPNSHGFDINANTFSNIKENLKNQKWLFGDDRKYVWTDLQRHARHAGTLPNPEAEELINWLINVNVETIGSKVSNYQLIQLFLGTVAPSFKYLPYSIWRLNRRVYKALSALYKRF